MAAGWFMLQLKFFFKTLNVTEEALSLLCADLNDPGDI